MDWKSIARALLSHVSFGWMRRHADPSMPDVVIAAGAQDLADMCAGRDDGPPVATADDVVRGLDISMQNAKLRTTESRAASPAHTPPPCSDTPGAPVAPGTYLEK
jgi:hypothetical protein